MKHRQLFLVVGPVLVLSVLTLVYFFYSPYTHLFPGCVLYESTGLYCPACGSQRAFSDLLQGHFTLALHNNLLFVTGAPVLIFLYFRYLHYYQTKDHSIPVASTWFCLLILFLILLFWILRNLPGFSWLAPYSH